MRLAGEIGIIEDAEQRALHAGLVECAHQEDRIAAPAAARVVGDISKSERRERRIAADCERLCDGLVERGKPRIKARPIGPAKFGNLAGERLGGALVMPRSDYDA